MARDGEEHRHSPPLLGWIDESGDPSIKPGTRRWFVAALVLETGPPGSLDSAMSDIKASLPPQAGAPAVPHFQALRFPLKQAAHERLAESDFTLIVAAIDTWVISLQSPLRRPQALYAHALSALIDQGSRVAGLSGCSLIATIEDSSVLNLDLLRAPATRAKGGAAEHGSGAFPPGNAAIHAQPKNSDLRLGAADGLANAFFSALERGSAGRQGAPTFADMHLSKLWIEPASEGINGYGWIMLPPASAARAALQYQWLATLLAGRGDKGAPLMCGGDVAAPATAPPFGSFFCPKAMPYRER